MFKNSPALPRNAGLWIKILSSTTLSKHHLDSLIYFVSPMLQSCYAQAESLLQAAPSPFLVRHCHVLDPALTNSSKSSGIALCTSTLQSLRQPIVRSWDHTLLLDLVACFLESTSQHPSASEVRSTHYPSSYLSSTSSLTNGHPLGRLLSESTHRSLPSLLSCLLFQLSPSTGLPRDPSGLPRYLEAIPDLGLYLAEDRPIPGGWTGYTTLTRF